MYCKNMIIHSKTEKKLERAYDFAISFVMFEYCGQEVLFKCDFGTIGVILKNK